MAYATRILLVAAAAVSACPDWPEWVGNEDCAAAGCTTSTATITGGPITVPTTTLGPEAPTTTSPPITTHSTGEPGPDLPPVFDEPPWISDLAVDPPAAIEIGPTIVTYKTSADAVGAQLYDDGVLIATGSAGEPFIFPVTSAPHNNPGSALRVVVHDAAEQTAFAEIFQPSAVKAPGTGVWITVEPDDGKASGGGDVALQGPFVISTGFHVGDNLTRMALRRYDQTGMWLAATHGWSRDHPDWTQIPTLVAANITGTAVAVDAGQNIIAVGNAVVAGETRMYLARFDPQGVLDWEVLDQDGTEGRGVAVTADGTIYVAGASLTAKNPERWDLAVRVYDADKVAYGADLYADPDDKLNQRSERGAAVTVLGSGRIAVAGTVEVVVEGWAEPLTRSMVLLYEGKGMRVGPPWISPGEVMLVDAAAAVVATEDGLALGGHAQDPADPQKKPQILLRWLHEDFSEARAPHLEKTLGPAACTALGYTIEGKLIVGAKVQEGDKGDNIWIYAVDGPRDPPITYLKHNGPKNAGDLVFGIDCDYMCAWSGYEGTGGSFLWLTGLLRG